MEIASRQPVVILRVLDCEGQPIGQVVQPKTSSPVLGRGAGTVLLVRSDCRGEKLIRV
jgi:hypothetical protein